MMARIRRMFVAMRPWQVTARAREPESDGDAETLHKLRVALSRLRALWWVFAPLMA
jgi:CHAD domain-containing protein